MMVFLFGQNHDGGLVAPHDMQRALAQSFFNGRHFSFVLFSLLILKTASIGNY
jgi:hypothetical protein